ncbi:MAG TPA: hypothetical protein VIW24_30385 [Aldersonia sp.]
MGADADALYADLRPRDDAAHDEEDTTNRPLLGSAEGVWRRQDRHWRHRPRRRERRGGGAKPDLAGVLHDVERSDAEEPAILARLREDRG